MVVKVTSKRQVTFPARVLEALGVKAGDLLELLEGPDGFLLRARRIDLGKLGTLRGKLRRGKGKFDISEFRASRLARSAPDC